MNNILLCAKLILLIVLPQCHGYLCSPLCSKKVDAVSESYGFWTSPRFPFDKLKGPITCCLHGYYARKNMTLVIHEYYLGHRIKAGRGSIAKPPANVTDYDVESKHNISADSNAEDYMFLIHIPRNHSMYFKYPNATHGKRSGFNITYFFENVQLDEYSRSNCNYNGYRVLYHTNKTYAYKCHCFNGFHGVDCQLGPECQSEKDNYKCNHGICREVASFIHCECNDSYFGHDCSISRSTFHNFVSELSNNAASKDDCFNNSGCNTSFCVQNVMGKEEMNMCYCNPGFVVQNKTCVKLDEVDVSLEVLGVKHRDCMMLMLKMFGQELGFSNAFYKRFTCKKTKKGSKFKFWKVPKHFASMKLANKTLWERQHRLKIKYGPNITTSLDIGPLKWNKEKYLFTCTAVGKGRKAQFTWLKDGVRMFKQDFLLCSNSSGETKTITWNSKSVGDHCLMELKIKRKMDIHAGNYTCSVSNEYYNLSSSVYVGYIPVSIMVLPSLTVTAEENSNVTVDCRSDDPNFRRYHEDIRWDINPKSGYSGYEETVSYFVGTKCLIKNVTKLHLRANGFWGHIEDLSSWLMQFEKGIIKEDGNRQILPGEGNTIISALIDFVNLPEFNNTLIENVTRIINFLNEFINCGYMRTVSDAWNFDVCSFHSEGGSCSCNCAISRGWFGLVVQDRQVIVSNIENEARDIVLKVKTEEIMFVEFRDLTVVLSCLFSATVFIILAIAHAPVYTDVLAQLRIVNSLSLSIATLFLGLSAAYSHTYALNEAILLTIYGFIFLSLNVAFVYQVFFRVLNSRAPISSYHQTSLFCFLLIPTLCVIVALVALKRLYPTEPLQFCNASHFSTMHIYLIALLFATVIFWVSVTGYNIIHLVKFKSDCIEAHLLNQLNLRKWLKYTVMMLVQWQFTVLIPWHCKSEVPGALFAVVCIIQAISFFVVYIILDRHFNLKEWARLSNWIFKKLHPHFRNEDSIDDNYRDRVDSLLSHASTAQTSCGGADYADMNPRNLNNKDPAAICNHCNPHKLSSMDTHTFLSPQFLKSIEPDEYVNGDIAQAMLCMLEPYSCDISASRYLDMQMKRSSEYLDLRH